MTRRRSGTGRPAVAEDAGSADHCPTSFYETNFSPVLDGRLVERSRENRSSGNHQRPSRKRPPTLWHQGNVDGPFRIKGPFDSPIEVSTRSTGFSGWHMSVGSSPPPSSSCPRRSTRRSSSSSPRPSPAAPTPGASAPVVLQRPVPPSVLDPPCVPTRLGTSRRRLAALGFPAHRPLVALPSRSAIARARLCPRLPLGTLALFPSLRPGRF